MFEKKTRIYLSVVLFSVLFLLCGHKFAADHPSHITITNRESELDAQVFARVTKIDRIASKPGDSTVDIVTFTAMIQSGKEKGSTVQATQYSYKDNPTMPAAVNVGDKVVLGQLSGGTGGAWAFENYDRIDPILILILVFLGLVLLFGGKKGICTILSLAFTCAALFFVYVPLAVSGCNIYLLTVLICGFIITISFVMTGGINRKSFAAALGCIGGVTFSAAIYLYMEKIMKLTGFYNDQSSRLVQLFSEQPLNLKSIVFAMVIIGALGATMDVAMSISSSLEEILSGGSHVTRYTLIKSGFSIGKDIMGTMTNTLILAYIGSSLTTVIIYAASNYPVMQLLNNEEIIVEFLESLVGSMGMLFTIPFTTVVSALFLVGKPQRVPLWTTPEEKAAVVPHVSQKRAGRFSRIPGSGEQGRIDLPNNRE